MTTVPVKHLKKAIKTADSACRGLKRQNCRARLAIRHNRVSVSMSQAYPIVTAWIDASGTGQDAEIVVPAIPLIKLLGRLTGETVGLEISDASLIVTGDNARFVIEKSDDSFPDRAEPEGAHLAFRADVSTFRKALEHCARSTAIHRKDCDAVYMRVDGDKLVMSSTDGYCVHEHTLCVEGEALSIAINSNDAKVLADALVGKHVSASCADGMSIFATDSVEVCASLVEATQLPYWDIIPRRPTTRLFVASGELHQAAKRLSSAVQTAILRLRGNELMMYSGDNNVTVALSVKVERVEGIPSRTIAVNPKYMADIIELAGETAEIWIGETARHPLFVTGRNFRGLLSPMTMDTISNEDDALRRAHHVISDS